MQLRHAAPRFNPSRGSWRSAPRRPQSITGYAENAVLSRGHIEPGMEMLTKPCAVDDLTARVDRMLRDAVPA